MKNGLPSARSNIRSTKSGVGRLLPNRGDELANLSATKRSERDPDRFTTALELVHERKRGVPARDLVTPVCDSESDRLLASGPHEEGQKIASRVVGPVHILDDQQERRLTRHGGQHRKQLLEQARLGTAARHRVGGVRAVRRLRVRRPQVREQPLELVDPGAGKAGHLRGAAIPDQRSQDPRDRRIQELATAERKALANQDGRAVAAGLRRELGQQAGLAHAGLAADDHDRADLAAGSIEGAPQSIELRPAPDEAGTDHASDHPVGSMAIPDALNMVSRQAGRDRGQ